MRGVTIKKEELKEVLIKNRTRHRAIFEEALEGYREAAIKLLDQALQDARDGKKIRTHIQLVEPMDQTADYDRVIRMLEMEVDDEVGLTADDFRMYVMDDWGWKGQFLAANIGYTKTDWGG